MSLWNGALRLEQFLLYWMKRLTTNFLCLRYWYWHSSQKGGPLRRRLDTSSHFWNRKKKNWREENDGNCRFGRTFAPLKSTRTTFRSFWSPNWILKIVRKWRELVHQIKVVIRQVVLVSETSLISAQVMSVKNKSHGYNLFKIKI